MDYITIPTTGNATDFGDLTAARYGLAGASSGFRGVFGGGNTYPLASYSDVMDYITIATTGNAVDFGDLTVTRLWPCWYFKRHKRCIWWWAMEASTE
jgi:hypothetical protein